MAHLFILLFSFKWSTELLSRLLKKNQYSHVQRHTDKDLRLVMTLHAKDFKGRRSNGLTVRAHTNGRMVGRTDYQVHYLPRFVVDKYKKYKYYYIYYDSHFPFFPMYKCNDE